jgi:hypothetical protein
MLSQFSKGLVAKDLAELREYRLGISQVRYHAPHIPLGAIRNIEATLKKSPNPHVQLLLDAVCDDLFTRFELDPRGMCQEIERAYYSDSSTLASKEQAYDVALDMMSGRIGRLTNKADLEAKEARLLAKIPDSPLLHGLREVYTSIHDNYV